MRYLMILLLLAGCAVQDVVAQERQYSGVALFRFVTPNNVTITVYDQPCKMDNPPANTPWRVTWEEKGKTYEGCVVPQPFDREQSAFAMQFDDRTVVCVPTGRFKQLEPM